MTLPQLDSLTAARKINILSKMDFHNVDMEESHSAFLPIFGQTLYETGYWYSVQSKLCD